MDKNAPKEMLFIDISKETNKNIVIIKCKKQLVSQLVQLRRKVF